MRHRLFTTVFITLLLATALAACGDDSSPTTPSIEPTTSATTGGPAGSPADIDGSALYADNCAGCHGAESGGGRGPDLAGQTDTAAVADQIEGGGSSMPAFADTLADDQIEAIAEHVTTGL